MILKGGTFGPVATNTYVVADARGGSAWIVDPAMGSRAWVLETLRRLDVTPVAVLDTHGHWDHVVENHLWAADGLPVWASAGDADWLEAPAPFNPALFGNPPPTPGVTPARLLGEGDVLELGDLRFATHRHARALAGLPGGPRADRRRGAGGRPDLRPGHRAHRLPALATTRP